jgi:hypothetical protein
VLEVCQTTRYCKSACSYLLDLSIGCKLTTAPRLFVPLFFFVPVTILILNLLSCTFSQFHSLLEFLEPRHFDCFLYIRMASASTLKMTTPTEQAQIAPAPIVRKFKASDLPLTTATRSAIEGLAHSFKKQGGYDAIRKQVWDKFEASVCEILRHC